eukprot:6465492-Amphidinium_carterae.1
MVCAWQMGGSTGVQQLRHAVSGAALRVQCCAGRGPLVLTSETATHLSKKANSTGTAHPSHGFDRPSGLNHPD